MITWWRRLWWPSLDAIDWEDEMLVAGLHNHLHAWNPHNHREGDIRIRESFLLWPRHFRRSWRWGRQAVVETWLGGAMEPGWWSVTDWADGFAGQSLAV